MSTILGYWVESDVDVYFVRDVRDVMPCHKVAFEGDRKGLIVTEVTEQLDVAPYVIIRHLKRGYILATKWAPLSPVPLEHDHTGKVAFEVVDFAEDEGEAIAIVNHLKLNKEPANV